MIETERLILRQWTHADVEPFAAMSASPVVMEFYPSPLSAEEAAASIAKWRGEIDSRGWGLWAAEEKATGEFLGLIGLQDRPTGLPFSPCVEIGWRLRDDKWGKGLATEGARATLAHGFQELGLKEIVSFTSTLNTPSSNVMERLHMRRVLPNFDHPNVESGHRLEEHVLYSINSVSHAAYEAVLQSGYKLPSGWIEVGAFGDSGEMAEDLLGLILEGTKTATSSLQWEYDHLNEDLPKVGDHEIVLDSSSTARCVIRYTHVEVKPFSEVGAEYAAKEGEADRTLESWRNGHWDFFTRVCVWIDREVSEHMPIVCTEFEVVHTL